MKIVPICLLFMLTVSTPAAVTPVGYLQFENGVLFAGNSTESSKRIGIGQATKLFVYPRLELSKQDGNKARSIRSMYLNANDTHKGIRKAQTEDDSWLNIK